MDSLTSLFTEVNCASLTTALKRNISVFEHWTSESHKQAFWACGTVTYIMIL